ncbi:T9SS type A sorting domain-containing protein, partial [bacterium]|nr:T9SS type A sorting domain-containing protein [bacterium]
TKGWSDGKACQSPMTQLPDGKWEIVIPTNDTIRTVHFVFTNAKAWDNNNSANWDIYMGGGGPPPVVHSNIITVSVLVDLSHAIQNRGFTYGDTVEARFGYYSTAKEVVTIPLLRQGISTFYAGTGDVTSTYGDTLDYVYYSVKNGKDNVEGFYNFDYKGAIQGEAQFRQVRVTKKSISVADTVRGSSNLHRPPFFRNMAVIAQDVLVTLECDVRPAIVHLLEGGEPLLDIQGTLNVGDPDSVLMLGVAVNGPITGSWSNTVGPDWGAHLMTLPEKRMVDDGTQGDRAAGDSVFTIQFQLTRADEDVVGQEFKFGIGGGDNEGGFGNNHWENVDDFLPNATIQAQFGSIDPKFYSEWDYSRGAAKSSVSSRNGIPDLFVLHPNHPNPFNPSTAIRYTLAHPEKVFLSVYNLAGEKVDVLLYGELQKSGTHEISWQAGNLGSGVYLIRMQAGDFVRTRKIMLMK